MPNIKMPEFLSLVPPDDLNCNSSYPAKAMFPVIIGIVEDRNTHQNLLTLGAKGV